MTLNFFVTMSLGSEQLIVKSISFIFILVSENKAITILQILCLFWVGIIHHPRLCLFPHLWKVTFCASEK